MEIALNVGQLAVSIPTSNTFRMRAEKRTYRLALIVVTCAFLHTDAKRLKVKNKSGRGKGDIFNPGNLKIMKNKMRKQCYLLVYLLMKLLILMVTAFQIPLIYVLTF